MASAQSIDDGTFDVTTTDFDLSETPPPPGQGSPHIGDDTSEADPWYRHVPDPLPTEYTYKTFPAEPPPGTSLKAAEYLPVINQGDKHPVMVLLHGGGWAKGCRYSMAGVAYRFATDIALTVNFIVLSIDYRLACNPTDPALAGSIVQPLCGWTYSTPDPTRSNTPGAAIHDAQDAVAWVWSTWRWIGNHNSIWNGKIALVGGSAGGNVSLAASILATGTSRPNAVAGLSPFARFTKMLNNTIWGCDDDSNDPRNCAIGELSGGYWEAGINRYLPCSKLLPPGLYYDPNCLSLYTAAGPYDIVAQGGSPINTYQANGGAGDKGLELASIQAARDFNNELGTNVKHELCEVNSQDHGTHLLNDRCLSDPNGNSVRWHLIDWLANNGICDDPLHPCIQ